MQQFEGCTAGYRYGLENKLIPGDYDAAILYCRENGQEDYAVWLEEQKHSEIFVRMNGTIFTMGAYQIYNPFTGQHQKYETLEQAKQAISELALEVINVYGPKTNRELANENGDATWIPVKLNLSISVEILASDTENM